MPAPRDINELPLVMFDPHICDMLDISVRTLKRQPRLNVFPIREVARFFKIPVALLGDLERSTYANHEQQMLAYYSSCLRPHLVAIEQELSSKLVSPLERNQQHVEHVVEGFLRADVERRGAYYTQMLDSASKTKARLAVIA